MLTLQFIAGTKGAEKIRFTFDVLASPAAANEAVDVSDGARALEGSFTADVWRADEGGGWLPAFLRTSSSSTPAWRFQSIEPQHSYKKYERCMGKLLRQSNQKRYCFCAPT
eukprot:COSAG02_NODE_2154_length_9654_cov_5.613919_6_plen_111_part_00